MIIGIDIDGVIADSLHTWVRELNQYFSQEKELKDIVMYQFEKVYNVTWAEMDLFFRENQELLLSNLAPIKKAKEVLDVLYKQHHIMLITARPEDYSQMTENWLNEYKIAYHKLIMTNYQDKSRFCQEMNIDIFIEDSLENAFSIHDTGIQVILFDAPYNQGSLPPGITRIKDWNEIYLLIEAL
jgi:uncharacterized HAD superfamily protein